MKRTLLFTTLLLWSVSAWAQSTKARTFNGTSDNLQSAATVDLTSTKIVSVAFWLWWDSFADDDDLVMEFGPSQAVAGHFYMDPNSSATIFQVHVSADSADSLQCSFTRPSAAAWHHYLFVFDMTGPGVSTCAIYVDGSTASPTTNNNTGLLGTGFDNATLNVMSRNATTLFGAGRISDIAIWKSALSAGNATSLAACANPATIGGGPDFYWPIKQVSPETPNAGGVNLTVNGTTNSNASCTNGHRNMMLLGVQ